MNSWHFEMLNVMIFKSHKYPFAINDDGKPIYIENVTPESRCHSHYYCYGCGAELFPVLGKVREHHFRHKKDAICDPNKYLHEYAKAEIKRRFDENEKFEVRYYAKRECRLKETCKLTNIFHPKECVSDGLYLINLKDYYDTCIAEKGFYQTLPDGKQKYIADLMLKSSQHPERKPVCIEIWVTHECTEEKKNSKMRLIEVKINTESDACHPIIESSNDSERPIHFYNFRKNINVTPSKTSFRHYKIKDEQIRVETIPCNEELYDKDAKYELIVPTDVSNEDGCILYFIYLNSKGLTVKHPFLCARGIYSSNKEKAFVSCKYLFGANKMCPCPNFVYSKIKKEQFLKKRFRDTLYLYRDNIDDKEKDKNNNSNQK